MKGWHVFRLIVYFPVKWLGNMNISNWLCTQNLEIISTNLEHVNHMNISSNPQEKLDSKLFLCFVLKLVIILFPYKSDTSFCCLAWASVMRSVTP